jgi:hypothetical protein
VATFDKPIAYPEGTMKLGLFTPGYGDFVASQMLAKGARARDVDEGFRAAVSLLRRVILPEPLADPWWT